MHPISLLLLLGTFFASSHQKGFTNPAYYTALKPGKYAGTMVWKVGDVEKISFDTPWPEYKIEWWQQSLVASAARVAAKPVYQQTKGQDLPPSFDWTVDPGQFDINDSPVFFFWMKEVSDVKDKKLGSQTSAFFNITDKPVEASPTTIQAPTTKASTSSMPGTSGNTASPPSSTTDQKPSEQQSGGGLSTGAAVGIGVGVGIAALAFVACAILLFMNRRKGERIPESGSTSAMPQFPNQTMQQPSYYLQQYGVAKTSPSTEPPKELPQYGSPPPPQELSNHTTYSAELAADHTWNHNQAPGSQR